MLDLASMKRGLSHPVEITFRQEQLTHSRVTYFCNDRRILGWPLIDTLHSESQVSPFTQTNVQANWLCMPCTIPKTENWVNYILNGLVWQANICRDFDCSLITILTPNGMYGQEKCPMTVQRGGSGNSDSVVSGSLASPTPLRGGRRKERGDEANTTESWGDLQGAGRVGRGQRRQDAGRIGRAVSGPSHADHLMETAIAGAGRGRVWRGHAGGGHAGSQDPPRQDWATGPGE